ncbi:hypothetical protein DI09_3p140 [Mitosporidium daphniae]|uniref:Uncharacterized protein n=1 Tax=Mitosporidium daphniae TaxID=1485682 RepID=A0A098VQC7_9MICR|nr:uncharacterized protein DI09_3p140 [Mitosporidium daphniae]KGG51252.1 hypothetical protein DI09_3p140 [Mitosporidium daphniae]|eukprot:XP_013237679.1 uncharacterized protein DI09_3p140 [Mitosporidium daphniae]
MGWRSYGLDISPSAINHAWELLFRCNHFSFLCALDPQQRNLWADKMLSLLLAKKGQLLTLMFPLYDAPSEEKEGPPFPLTEAM